MNPTDSLPFISTPDERVLPAVWKLLSLRLRISWNGFRRSRLRRKIGLIVIGLLILSFAAFMVTISLFLLKGLRSPEVAEIVGINLQPLLASIPVLVLSGLFIGLLLTSFGVLLQALYLSGDMDFLLAAPVPIRAIFIAKLLQAVLPNFAFISLFGLPLLFGLGFSGAYNFLYYPLTLLVMIALALAAAGLAALLVMLVVRILPPRRAAEILGFFGAIIGMTCSQIGNLSNSFGNSVDIPGEKIGGLLLRANTPWLPLNWAGQGLVALGEGHWLSGLLLVGLTLGLVTAVFWFALATAERWYYSGWAGMQVIGGKKKPPRRTQAASLAGENGLPRLARLLPQPVWGLLWKDALTLRRDLRNLSQLISPLILGVIYSLMLFRSGGGPMTESDDAPLWLMSGLNLFMTYSSVGMSLFVGWMLLARLAGMAFSQEGKNYWMLKAAPLRTAHLLQAKFIVAYLPVLGVSLAFLLVTAFLQRMTLFEFLFSLAAVAFCLAGMVGLQLSFGVLGANFTWDDPRKMGSGGMGCLGSLLTMVLLPLSFGAFVGPVTLVGLLSLPIPYGYLVGLVLGMGISAGCAILPLWLVRKRVESLDES